jgi:hypothetical protein
MTLNYAIVNSFINQFCTMNNQPWGIHWYFKRKWQWFPIESSMNIASHLLLWLLPSDGDNESNNIQLGQSLASCLCQWYYFLSQQIGVFLEKGSISLAAKCWQVTDYRACQATESSAISSFLLVRHPFRKKKSVFHRTDHISWCGTETNTFSLRHCIIEKKYWIRPFNIQTNLLMQLSE